MVRKICVLLFFVIVSVAWAQTNNQAVNYQTNNCVSCHAKIAQPVSLSNSYFEWHSSAHKESGVACEKCHGGDPTTKDTAKAHVGVQSYTDPNSRVNYRNLPATCSACHQGVVNFFTASRHYQTLQSSGLGPSCTTCHGHMATRVILSPPQTAALCAHCHDTINGALPPRPALPAKAEAVMQAINRADVAVEWCVSLLREAETKRLYIPTDRIHVVAAQGLLKEAKFSWHAFDLEATQKKADEAFSAAMKAKEELEKKVVH